MCEEFDVSSFIVTRSAKELRNLFPSFAKNMKIGLVPTMGFLHEGHVALLKKAREQCDVVISSLFVNPTQFGSDEDFGDYPRDEARDLEILKREGVNIVYAPDTKEMYPKGQNITVTVSGITERLCGLGRPGHFDGVTTVVSKLFSHCNPDIAYFGEKDYQQLKVIQKMAREKNLKQQIVGVPIVREADGLAMSSRNVYLNPEERRIAPSLNAIINEVSKELQKNRNFQVLCNWGCDRLLSKGFSRVEYFEICDSETLQPTLKYSSNLRILVAAWLGNTRLIDNRRVD